MLDIKEKPAMGKPKARDKAALLPQQAGRLMKEKYLRQLDQRPPSEEDGTEYATRQVEDSAHCAVDELVGAALRRPLKERRYAEPLRPSAGTKEGDPPRAEPGLSQNRPACAPKKRPAARTMKERTATCPTTEHSAATPTQKPKPTPAAVRSDKAGHPSTKSALNNRRRGFAALHPPTVTTAPQSAQPLSPHTKPAPGGTLRRGHCYA